MPDDIKEGEGGDIVTDPVPVQKEESEAKEPIPEPDPETGEPRIDFERLSIGDLEEEETTENDEKKDEPKSEDETTEDDSTEETEEQEGDTTLVQDLQSAIGLDFGEDVEFEDSVEGILELVRVSAEEFAANTVEKVFEQYPDLRDLYQYLEDGGAPDQFYSVRYGQEDFSKVEIPDNNEDVQAYYVAQKLRAEGFSDEQVTVKVERFKASGILKDEAQDAVDILAKAQKEQQDNLLVTQEAQRKEHEKGVAEFWDETHTLLKKHSKFAGITIPETVKDDFFAFMKEPVSEEDERTKLQIAQKAMTKEQKMAISFLLYNEFNLSDIIDRKAKTDAAQKLKDRLTVKGSNGTLKSDVSEVSGPADPASFDFSKAPPLI
jgi:hypothetical protein